MSTDNRDTPPSRLHFGASLTRNGEQFHVEDGFDTVMSDAKPWTCPHCRAEQPSPPETICPACETPLYPTWAIMVAHHVLEHLQDGLSQPLEILEAMQSRDAYRNTRLELHFIAQQIRLLTKDTTTIARQLARARSSKIMLDVLETGNNNHKLAVLTKWGPETNAERVEHSGSVSIEDRLHAARKRSAAAKEKTP